MSFNDIPLELVLHIAVVSDLEVLMRLTHIHIGFALYVRNNLNAVRHLMSKTHSDELVLTISGINSVKAKGNNVPFTRMELGGIASTAYDFLNRTQSSSVKFIKYTYYVRNNVQMKLPECTLMCNIVFIGDDQVIHDYIKLYKKDGMHCRIITYRHDKVLHDCSY